MTANDIILVIVVTACISALLAALVRKNGKYERENFDLKVKCGDKEDFIAELRNESLVDCTVLSVPNDNIFYVLGWKKSRNNGTQSVVIRKFPYNPLDKEDIAYAKLCAEELKEAIEYDWRIKNYYEE